MARSFYGVMKQAARSAERSYKRSLREHERALRQAEAHRKAQEREYLRQAKTADKAARLAYTLSREGQVLEMNEDLSRRVTELRSMLARPPEGARPFNFTSLKKQFVSRVPDTASLAGSKPEEPQRETFVTPVPRPNLVRRLLGGKAKYEAALRETEENDKRVYEAAVEKYRVDIADWCVREENERIRFEELESARRIEIEEHNAGVDDFENDYKRGLTPVCNRVFLLDPRKICITF